MKKLLIALGAVMALTGQANAVERVDWCGEVSESAINIMYIRQHHNPPILEALEFYKDAPTKIWSQIAQGLVLQAYDRPRYKSATRREASIRNFKIAVFKECMDATKK